MDQKSLEDSLAGLPLERIAYFDSVGSTNDIVGDWAKRGQQGIGLAVANEQSAGRGRAGRQWFTPAGSALAFSLLMPVEPLVDLGKMASTAGLPSLAVCQAMENLYKLSPEIKWPNDVLLDGKKMCGVLAEAHWSGERLQTLIYGIGINIAPKSVPQEEKVNFPATCLEDELGRSVKRDELLRTVLERLFWLQEQGRSSQFIRAWESRLAFKDQDVRLKDDKGNVTEGSVLGLDREGGIRLQTNSNEAKVFQAGEIQLRPFIDNKV